ncbi:hypothetical protein G3M48_001140 [Beauveria asiatica]|uniref:Secreted protein n=1 Tax=Beauveria asiatica TaxID=1069075 RepID=A0AAW0S8Q2_9HYPO
MCVTVWHVTICLVASCDALIACAEVLCAILPRVSSHIPLALAVLAVGLVILPIHDVLRAAHLLVNVSARDAPVTRRHVLGVLSAGRRSNALVRPAIAVIDDQA